MNLKDEMSDFLRTIENAMQGSMQGSMQDVSFDYGLLLRSVHSIRASVYNSVPAEIVRVLMDMESAIIQARKGGGSDREDRGRMLMSFLAQSVDWLWLFVDEGIVKPAGPRCELLMDFSSGHGDVGLLKSRPGRQQHEFIDLWAA